jgi:hypothetical protein
MTTGILTVVPDLTLAERIACGKIPNDLTEKEFPVLEDQYGEWEWKLFFFKYGGGIHSTEAIELMRKEGYDIPQVGHSLAFRESSLKEHKEYPIVALGSLCRGRRVIVLTNEGGKCSLRRAFFDSTWYGHEFLGVRRRSETSGT